MSTGKQQLTENTTLRKTVVEILTCKAFEKTADRVTNKDERTENK